MAVGRAAAVVAAALVLPIAAATTVDAAPTPRGHLRGYDRSMLSYVNHVREVRGLRPLHQSNRLYRIAHSWAEHMAAHRKLGHDPGVRADLGKRCPRWRMGGENIAAQVGTDAHELFELYMHHRGHRRNILQRRYTDIGIATIHVYRDGQSTEWDVMDFANHCR
ncbi:MAG TPA: CAP domain-containing protein [Mycobacteriales bacterium]|nr:CAP domain-containing protein [Mycobacteriales bacterium]